MTPRSHAKHLRSLELAILVPFFSVLLVLTAALVVVPLAVSP